jgi:meso-butanediol dehydrogenase/(S,S)-butanediol dehydrogenase/diacetyl reductase
MLLKKPIFPNLFLPYLYPVKRIIESTFRDKVVIVTGSSQGIGKAAALAFLEARAKVVINGRNQEKLQKTREEFESIGFQPLAVQGDMSDYKACQDLVSKTVKHFGRIDILVNNAGGGFRGRIDETDPLVFKNVIEANLMSSVFCTQAALPEIKKSRGSIVFISSLSGIRGMPKNGPYCVAKMGLTAFAQTLRLELAELGVHIGILLVGWTDFDDNKRVVSADGSLVPISRKSKQTREQVANIILLTVLKKKHRVVLTFPGKVLDFFDKACPSLLDFVLRKSANTEKYNK